MQLGNSSALCIDNWRTLPQTLGLFESLCEVNSNVGLYVFTLLVSCGKLMSLQCRLAYGTVRTHTAPNPLLSWDIKGSKRGNLSSFHTFKSCEISGSGKKVSYAITKCLSFICHGLFLMAVSGDVFCLDNVVLNGCISRRTLHTNQPKLSPSWKYS